MTSGCTSCWVMASTCFCCKWHIKSPISTKRCCTSGWVSVDNVPAAVAPAPAETPMPTPAPSSVMRPALPPSAATSTDAPPSGEASMPIELGETQETPITTGGRSRLGGCALGAISGEVNFERTVEAAEVSAGPSNGDPLLLKVDDTAASTSENGSNSSNDPVMPILLAPGDAKAPTPPPSLTTEATTFRPKRWSSSSSSSSRLRPGGGKISGGATTKRSWVSSSDAESPKPVKLSMSEVGTSVDCLDQFGSAA
mmetsp:Transcript_138062/g.349828  ORF Transcript_138062/g.349828 Transcript_138062/m.349828 type:complete len:254 (-) Transcript_138062:277-1038(-)